jgi:Tol biopolymer transport system component
MKQRSLIWSCAVLTFTAVTGCIPGDTGGGGGMGSFSKGFAFVRDRDIYVADDSNVSNPLQLTTTADNRNPSLSKDRRVVFVRGSAELWVANATSDPKPTQVPLGTASITGVHTPVFSPDGSTIVFAFEANGISSLARVNVDGSNPRPLTLPTHYYAGPSFYSDGSAVLAARGSTPDYTELVRVDINSGSETVIASLLGTPACAIANRVALAPNGAKVSFDARTNPSSGCGGPVRIFVVDLVARTVTRLTNYPADPAAQDGFPTWVGNDLVGYASDAGAGINNVYWLQAGLTDTSGVLRVPTASEPYYGPN